MKRLLAAAAAGLLWFAAPASAEPIIQTVEQHSNDRGEIDRRGSDFVHRPTGYIYPAVVGDMPARETITYGPGDASLYYTLNGGGNGDPWLSLYVYPATGVELQEEVAAVETALNQAMKGTPIARPKGVPELPPGVVEKWYDATAQTTPVTTGYWLMRDGDWFLKVRLSIPKSGGQPALDRAWRGLAAVRWSVPRPAKPSKAATAGRPVVLGAR